jgi:hypothetical protein
LFFFEKNNDGTYCFIYNKPTNDGYESMVLYANNLDELSLKPYSSEDKNGIYFYIEVSDSSFVEIEKEYTSDGKFLSKKIDSTLRNDEYEFYTQFHLRSLPCWQA